MVDIRHVHLQCDCDSPDHVVRVTLTTWPGEMPRIVVQPFLNPNYSFLKRIWLALKFVFLSRRKPESHWGSFHYDSVLLDEKQVNQLSSMIIHYKLIKKLRAKKEGVRQDEETGLNPVSAVPAGSVGGASPSPSSDDNPLLNALANAITDEPK